jgi:hypothetical protein
MKPFLVAILISVFALPAHALDYTGSTAHHSYVVGLIDPSGRDVRGADVTVTEFTLSMAEVVVQGPGIPFQYGVVEISPDTSPVALRLVVTTISGAQIGTTTTPVTAQDVVAQPLRPRVAGRIQRFNAMRPDVAAVLKP